jgi:hypothetical protein
VELVVAVVVVAVVVPGLDVVDPLVELVVDVDACVDDAFDALDVADALDARDVLDDKSPAVDDARAELVDAELTEGEVERLVDELVEDDPRFSNPPVSLPRPSTASHPARPSAAAPTAHAHDAPALLTVCARTS